MIIKHIDLFSGIGGFSYALDTVFYGHTLEHIFCDSNEFCQAILKKHWPHSLIYGNIKELTSKQIWYDLTQRDKKNGGKNTLQKSGVIGTPTIIETGTNFLVKRGHVQKLDENESEKKFLRHTDSNAFVVGKSTPSFLTSTTKTTTEILKEKSMELRGNITERNCKVFPTPTKSFVSTVTSQNLSTKYVHTNKIDFLTGGFPCQPFSQAGRRRGTKDDRWLWYDMLRLIHETQPTWIIAENVRGLITIENGMVLEQVCTDLENEGYEVQPFIIPAVAVNAPHRRDRVWIIAHASGPRAECDRGEIGNERGRTGQNRTESLRQAHGEIGTGGATATNTNVSNTPSDRRERGGTTVQNEKGHAARSEQTGELAQGFEGRDSDASNPDTWRIRRYERSSAQQGAATCGGWESNWLEVATRLCSVDDGLSGRMGDVAISKPRHRKEQLKAYGNAIVPQVAMQIFEAIKSTL